MRLLALATLAFVASASIAVPAAGGSPVTVADALPRPGERLAEPIWLPHCGTWLVEWRPTPSLRAETTASEQATAVIDGTCKQVLERYGDFLRNERLPSPRSRPDRMPLFSLLPANVLRDGKTPRALNDWGSRFEAVAPECCYWGLYVDALHHLFLRNDPLVVGPGGRLEENPRFVRTLTHELSHVLSARLGVWEAIGFDRQRDEELAEAFVAFMGLHFATETSEDDLAFHGGAPSAPATDGTPTAPIATKRTGPEAPAQGVAASTSQQH